MWNSLSWDFGELLLVRVSNADLDGLMIKGWFICQISVLELRLWEENMDTWKDTLGNQ